MDAGTLRAVEVWHRRCLAKDTKIAMSDGGYKLIQDIIAGDTVLSFNNGKLTTNIVKGLFKNGKTKVRKYNDLFCTPDHKVLNYHKKKYEEISNTSHLVNAGELSFGYNHDPELAEILGLLLTDGYIKKNQTPKFTNIDERLLRRFEKLIKMRFPDIITKRYKKGNGFDIVCPTRVKTNYHPLRKFFKTSNTFPEIVWGFDKESSLAFLNGVISGDGSISFKETETPRGYVAKCGNMVIEAGISRELSEDYKLFLQKFGIRAKLKKDKRGNNHRVYVYSLKELHRLRGLVITSEHKQKRFLEILNTTTPFQTFKREKIVQSNYEKEDETYDIEVENNHNYIANGYIVHNSGKDKTLMNLMAKKMMERIGTYFYFFPTYNQGKKILWEGRDKDGFKFTDHIPEDLRVRTNASEMLIEIKNGSIFQIIGTDNIDSIVGTNTIGCVFSEYALQNPDAWRFIRPILAENGGWAVFNFTPRGKNHGHDIYQLAKRSPDWFCEKLTVDDTGAIPKKVLEQEKMEIIEDTGDDALFYQEYYCSFDAPMQGSYYGKEMTRAEEENRITKVPHDSELLVDTWWDLGIGDSTCIWFVQTVGNEVRIIDYYENSGEGLAHYIAELASLREKNDYVYRYHNAPHDIEVRELGTGKSRYETAYELGIAFHIVPNIPVEDGINAVRALLKRCWFDDEKCKQGLNALRCYHKEWDDKRMEFKPKPFHDWSCLSGNTKIRTLNGWVPIKEMKGDEYVWGYSFSEHRLIPTKISFAGKTGSNVQLLEIGLDNNKSIKCTPEHLFLMRDESYKRADELITGDSLMPFYETPNRGYTQINLNDGSFADEHRFVYYRFHKKPDLGNHVNHIDSNHFNNNPENLSELTPDAHCSETFTGLNNTDRKLIDKTDYNREFYSGKELYKICKNCGKEYWGSFKTVYCSDKCRKKYRIKRDRDGLVLSRGKEAVNKRNREAYWKKKNHKVRFIKMAGKEDVYDLTVPETSNFVAEGIVVHNSHGADAFRMLAVGHMDEQRGPEKETDYNEDYDRFALI